ncbi:ribosomal protein L15 [Cavenderia fasciculata]|uniref:Ribosomal protein L15 n=1 Tax=Cavenderia fasciculata TaxID=261658 RepID=F4PYR3_CACFS|nr:ribosomal protein L15 [Cavenderia fasciculata]EGG19329.1 ribosomal protein L15 [Cavenderia fasciculata]|eukprot:XP_004357600.1 ribosomal protein L15 [Cavenderia fasciculata]
MISSLTRTFSTKLNIQNVNKVAGVATNGTSSLSSYSRSYITSTSSFTCKSYLNNNKNNNTISINNNQLLNIKPTTSYTSVRTIITQANEISLNNLRDNPGANKKRIRLGRGIGSGRGKTSGRGHGGQKARAGHNIPRGFEGGQTPLFKKMRKYGFSNATFARELSPLNLAKLDKLISEGRIDISMPITMKTLFDQNAVGRIRHGVKILAQGSETFKHKINIEMSDFSESARQVIEELGGTATNVYYDRVGLKFLLKPEKFDFTPKRARVPLKLKEKYPDHPTGYLGAYSTTGSPPTPKEE